MKAKLSDRYYTHEEALAKLGMTKGRFQYWIRSGKVKKITPPNSKQGVYLKKEIDDLAREMLAFMIGEENEGIRFMKATVDDIQEEYDLATFMFGNAVHDLPTRHAWLEKNPDIDFIVRDQGRLVAFINILPAKHDTIMRFMRGEIRGWDIPAEDVVPFTPGSQIECILMGMATTPEADITKRAYYGRRLIIGLMRFIHELAEKNITITKFYATSVTPTGIAILHNGGFQVIGQLGKRTAFMLDVMNSDTPLAVQYRELLSEHSGHENGRDAEAEKQSFNTLQI